MDTSTQLTTFAIEKEKNHSINIKSVINNYKHHWYVFLISIAIALIIAFIYLLVANPVYEIKASLLINQDNNQNTQQQQSVLDKIDLPSTSEITENEIAKLKSTNLIQQVVTDLNLATVYKIKKGPGYKDIYNSVPFRFLMIKPNPNFVDEKRDLNITLKDTSSFFYDDQNGKQVQARFNTYITSPIGIWKLQPTSDIGFFKNATIKVSLLDPEKVTQNYQKAIDASLQDKLASAVDLTISDNNIQRGKDILNHLIFVYDNAEVQQKTKETQSTIKFIDQRLASLTGELTNSEKNIASFKSSNQLTDIESASKYNLDNLQTNDAKLNELNVQLSIVNEIEKYINNPDNKGRAPAAIGIADPTLVSLIEKLSVLELKRQEMLATMPETNPDFEQVNRQIQTTRTSIKETVHNIKSSLLSAQNKVQAVNTHVESSITSIPGQEREYLSIKRQQSIKENLYIYLLQKREEVSLNYAKTVKNYRVLDNAYNGPLKWPKKNLVYAAALVLGLILAIVFIFFKDRLHNVIINPDDIEEETGVPVINEININDSGKPIVISEKNNSLISEQFRTLRSKLHYLTNFEEKSRVILLTSSISEEGKTFISSNLGVVLASAGKKVVILELDLRRAKLSGTFGLSKTHPGITDYILNKATINDIIRPSSVIPSLDIVSAGSSTDNPSELLEDDRLTNLITELRKTYHTILIDSPPVHLVTDAMILSRLAQLTLYVIRQGVTKKTELKFIKELNQEGGVPNMHIVFNGVNNERYGYGYGYDNSYYTIKTA
ncbi:MAG: polysaccharide biosynthesis tyrosine autokinase [Mucilaginibacter sp.]|uniref:GumC family protein n=1 Tax=Mucilaginibacter sp. TaxID=1882438 RepID=UPI00262447BC|nr:polysaccharide biosynthesis tyrosine autokinase [Mucilaginibacter sp.]MDB5004485.1 polysaccharide biosynthesis tyrosine autokinase [Mucilaginibacter sp.]